MSPLLTTISKDNAHHGSSLFSLAKFVSQAVIFMILGAIVSFFLLDNDVWRLLPLLASPRNELHSQLIQAARNADHIRYLPSEKILAAVTAKGGSTSFWKWMYTSVTGNPEFNCTTYVQNVRANCWENKAVSFTDLSDEDKIFAMTHPSVLRVAVWRDPFDRVISCWKSKFACDAWIYGTDYPDRARMVPQLRKVAAMPYENVECLNITQFAETLDNVRRRIASNEVSVYELNPHIRPQQFFFSLINYSLILDVSQLSNATAIRPLIERLPLANKSGIDHLHASQGAELTIPESAATLIAKFSSLTESLPESLPDLVTSAT